MLLIERHVAPRYCHCRCRCYYATMPRHATRIDAGAACRIRHAADTPLMLMLLMMLSCHAAITAAASPMSLRRYAIRCCCCGADGYAAPPLLMRYVTLLPLPPLRQRCHYAATPLRWRYAMITSFFLRRDAAMFSTPLLLRRYRQITPPPLIRHYAAALLYSPMPASLMFAELSPLPRGCHSQRHFQSAAPLLMSR